VPNLSLPAAAAVWGVSRRTAYRMAEQGLVRVARFGRRLTIPAEEVDRVRLEGVSAPLELNPPAPLPSPRPGRPRGAARRNG